MLPKNTNEGSPLRLSPLTSGRREWMSGLLTVLILVVLQSQWDASIITRDGGGNASVMASAVASGDLLRRVLGVALGLTGAVWLRLSKDERCIWTAFRWVLFGWIAWLCVSVPFSDDYRLSSKRIILLLMGLISMAAFAKLPIAKLFACSAFGVLINLVVGLAAEISLGTFTPWQSHYRLAGLTHPNMQGLTLAAGIFAAAGLALVSARLRRIGYSLAALFLSCLFLTGSRTAIISFGLSSAFCGLLFILRRAYKRSRLMHVATIMALSLCLTATIFTSFPAARGAILAGMTEARDGGRPEQLTGRVDLWKVCHTYTTGHLILGYGYQAFWSPRHIREISDELGWAINEAHSGYIDLVLMSGLPGVLLFIALLVGATAYSVRAFFYGSNEHVIWATLCIFALIHCLTESIVLPITYASYLLIVGIFRITRVRMLSVIHSSVRRNQRSM